MLLAVKGKNLRLHGIVQNLFHTNKMKNEKRKTLKSPMLYPLILQLHLPTLGSGVAQW